jgi:predicted RNA polymerase sigma factor
MAEGGDSAGLLLKAAQAFGIGCERWGQYFDRDLAAQARVARTIDLAHTACADQGDEFVGAEFRARSEGHKQPGLYRAKKLPRWDRDLIGRGFDFLERASMRNELSEYHLEAGIAFLHCAAPAYVNTEWAKILELYDILYRLQPSPIVALNRAFALGKALGPDEGLAELRKIPDPAKLKDDPFYPAAQGEFHLLAGRPAEAGKHFEKP